ncbi:hypothetical protein HOY82DRAFT_564143 [Tuber indicum]|nr:hypothetical protein HOY82DRAFT_564143 [Tuber indicum]
MMVTFSSSYCGLFFPFICATSMLPVLSRIAGDFDVGGGSGLMRGGGGCRYMCSITGSFLFALFV